jgi:hypothetical protein
VIEYRPWLPETALLDGKIESAFNTAIENWLASWFLKDQRLMTLASRSFKEGEWKERTLRWDAGSNQISFHMDDKNWRLLFGELIRIPLGRKKLNEHDREFGDTLVDHFMQDVYEFTAGFFQLQFQKTDLQRVPAERYNAAEGTFVLSVIWNDGTPLFHLVIGEDLITSKRKALAYVEKWSGSNVQPRRDGVANQTVRLGALTGRAEISLADLEGLAPGDVLVLDQSMAEPISTTIDGIVCDDFPCHIEQENGALHFRIISNEENNKNV